MIIRNLFSALVAITVSLTSCTNKMVVVAPSSHHQNLPPGQEKKIYGEKSAKSYAPGQQKKGNTEN
ncbi:hypothetical protein [Flavihumibacter profundi]|uniref:hypothetical protein n=1 Tax=Flavihumibacter profundi TaxID=2716883 RepID=UPI001CC6550F|nr:hypothetical protein [Flavihumibacter profundi]MBZ5858665.1 hypothetical protein [Flavihumibacter profundi]